MSRLVSIILCCRNNEDCIERSVESILKQTYNNIELIVVDDFSSDKTVSILSKIKDHRIKIYVKKNGDKRYLASSRNIGIGISKGDYITFQDADDISSPDRIEKQLECFKQEKKINICGTNIVYDHFGKLTYSNLPLDHEMIVKGFTRQKNRATVVGATLMFQSEILKKNNYKEYLRFAQDWDLTLRLFEKSYFFANTKDFLYTYYRHDSNSRKNKEWDWCNLLIRINQLKRKKKLNEIDSTNDLRKYFVKEVFKSPILIVWYLYLKYKRYIS